jgi:hypothetical protein
MQDRVYRTLLLAEMLVKKMFPAWVLGIRPREEGKQWWKISGDGIVWEIPPSRPESHADHIEMSGFKVSAIVSYGVDNKGRLRLFRHIIWPRLRTWPNNTHASFSHSFAGLLNPQLRVDGHPLCLDRPTSFHFDGILSITGTEAGIEWKRSLWPDASLPIFCERIELRNISSNPLPLHCVVHDSDQPVRKKKEHGTSFLVRHRFSHPPVEILAPGESFTVDHFISAADPDSNATPAPLTNPNAFASRRALINEVNRSLVLETGDEVLDLAFTMAKLRASESIYRTKGGLMHSPGGGDFYAALWTNDQCEYVNPYFSWSGYGPGLDQAMNGYRLFAAHMDPAGLHALPSSIIAEGDGIWNGAGDRGDAAMYAQGAGRFLLASGRRDWMEELRPAIDWCLNWSEQHRLAGTGPVCSDSDELENRFPSGSTNLSTSVLHYDALISRAYLARSMGNETSETNFLKCAASMRKTINEYFGAAIQGFETYKYFESCSILRAWICLPLTVGITERSAGTMAALFSPHLWTINGLRTASDHETVWDRSTLFAMRGGFCAGAEEPAFQKLKEYSLHRLLGAHVPYPCEAFPEGNRRHLSAESGLYCRIFIEGMFGLRPTGLRRFDWTPRLPDSLPRMALRRIAAFGAVAANGAGLLDLEVERTADHQLQLQAWLHDSHNKPRSFINKTITPGETVRVEVPETRK